MNETVERTSEPIPDLSIGRAYTADQAAAMLGIKIRTFNERVKEGWIQPISLKGINGDRRYSGYDIAKLLGWPLTDDPRDYIPKPPEITPNQIVDSLLERAMERGERSNDEHEPQIQRRKTET